MAHRIPECLAGLAGERAAGGVGDGARDHHRQPQLVDVEVLLDGEQRRLGIERVENGFDDQDVDTALDQAVDGFQIGRAQLVEADIAEAGVIDVRRNGGGARGGSQHAGDEARFVRILCGRLVGGFARQAGSGEVELRHQMFHVVVRHGNRGGIEGVGLEDVGAGSQILVVNVPDDVRLRQGEQVVVALEVVRKVGETFAAIVGFAELVGLDHRPHRAVQDEDALGEQGMQQGGAGHGGRP